MTMTFDEWRKDSDVEYLMRESCRFTWLSARVGMVSVEAVCQWIADDSCHRHGPYCACGACVYGGRIAEQLRTMLEERDGR